MPYRYRPQGGSTYPGVDTFLKLITRAESEKNPDARPLLALAQRAIRVNMKLLGLANLRGVFLHAFNYRAVAFDAKDQLRADEAMMRLRPAINAVIESNANTAICGASVHKLSAQLVGGAWTIGIERTLEAWEAQVVSRQEVQVLADEQQLRIIATLNKRSSEYRLQRDWLIDNATGILWQGAAESIMRLEMIRYHNIADWADLNRLLKGLIHVKNSAAGDEDEQAAIDATQNAAEGRFVQTSDLINIEGLKIADASGGVSMEKLANFCDAAASILMIGNANTSEVKPGSGSRAALQVLAQLGADVVFSDQKRIKGVIDDLFRMDFQMNYEPSAQQAPWQLEYNEFENNDNETNMIVIERALQAGIQLKADEVYGAIGFTRPDGTPDILTSTPL
ncbi:MAG: DUF935 family protein [Candidatus Kapabacteria bacterium]|nr:DUF935 family protein [Candidatus Kapabacteria bacterium]